MDIGSPLVPAQAKTFKDSFESKWFKDFPLGLKSVFYLKYVHELFVLFSSLSLVEKFKDIYHLTSYKKIYLLHSLT